MWGMAAGVSVGLAAPSAGLQGNVYFYSPFGWYPDMGHEILIGVGVSAISVDLIFGCCASPMSANGMPLAFVTERKAIKIPAFKTFSFAVPKFPYVKFTGTGAALGIGFEEEEELGESNTYTKYGGKYSRMKIFQRSTGRELDLEEEGDEARLVLKHPEDRAKAAEERRRLDARDEETLGETGLLELTINLGYSRSCRRFTASRISSCFKHFNPVGGTAPKFGPSLPAPKYCQSGFTKTVGHIKTGSVVNNMGGGQRVNTLFNVLLK